MQVKRICSVDGCDRQHYGRGMCSAHYQRWRHRQNPEKAREIDRKWRETYPERVRERKRKYRLAHPEKRRDNNRRRLARKANTIVTLTVEEETVILARGCFFGSLGDCEGPLCIAHDVPLSKGGNTTEANVFCLCRRHNLRMWTRTLAEMFSQLTFVEEEVGGG